MIRTHWFTDCVRSTGAVKPLSDSKLRARAAARNNIVTEFQRKIKNKAKRSSCRTHEHAIRINRKRKRR